MHRILFAYILSFKPQEAFSKYVMKKAGHVSVDNGRKGMEKAVAKSQQTEIITYKAAYGLGIKKK